jgi:hypothetical protein
MGGDGKMDVVVLEANGIVRCGDDRSVVLVILRERRRSHGARRMSRRANASAICQRRRACEADFGDLGLATRLGRYGLDPQTGSVERMLARALSRKINAFASQEGLWSEMRIERRLAAILAADVVGYSRLMGQDELGTLARLRASRSSHRAQGRRAQGPHRQNDRRRIPSRISEYCRGSRVRRRDSVGYG